MSTIPTAAVPTNGNNNDDDDINDVVTIVIIGCGWWTQGWHLPQLYRNPKVQVIGLVDVADHPKSSLNPNLVSLYELSIQYKNIITNEPLRIYKTVDDLLMDTTVAPIIDGIVIATPHATHARICEVIIHEGIQRYQAGLKPITILLEKPMTTDVTQAKRIKELVDQYETIVYNGTNNNNTSSSLVLLNHSGNYRVQTQLVKHIIERGDILGNLKLIALSFASPLLWIFDNPTNVGWNAIDPTVPSMVGNGFAWGQSSHVLAWIYSVCESIQLIPEQVFCTMDHSDTTGADITHSATILCSSASTNDDSNNDTTTTTKENNEIIMNMIGTTLLPGNAHSEPPVGKVIRFEIYGTNGSLIYGGNDQDITSGRIEIRSRPDGTIVPLETIFPDIDTSLLSTFVFEELQQDGIGPQSILTFINCCYYNRNLQNTTTTSIGTNTTTAVPTVLSEAAVASLSSTTTTTNLPDLAHMATVSIGYKTIQTISAMYYSHHNGRKLIPIEE